VLVILCDYTNCIGYDACRLLLADLKYGHSWDKQLGNISKDIGIESKVVLGDVQVPLKQDVSYKSTGVIIKDVLLGCDLLEMAVELFLTGFTGACLLFR